MFSTDVITPSRENSSIATIRTSDILTSIPATPTVTQITNPGGPAFSFVTSALSFNDTNTGTVPSGSTPFTGQRPTNGQATFEMSFGPVTSNRDPENDIYNLTLQVGQYIRFRKDGNAGNIYNVITVGAETTYTRTIAGVVYNYSRKLVTVDRDFDDQFTAGDVDTIEEVRFETSPILATVNPAIFETIPKNDVDTDLYYEATNARPMSSFGNAATLSYFNCFTFGNGVESANIKDDFNSNTLSKGVRVSSTVLEPYNEEKRGVRRYFH